MSLEIIMDLVAALKTLLGDAVTMKFTAHGFHWNVEGQDFAQYHDLFANIYEDLDSSIDPIAENIRKMGAYAPFTLSRLSALRSISDVDPGTPAEQPMAVALLKMNEAILKSIMIAFDAAMKENQQGIANFLAERQDMHMKWKWQLTASTK
jgi:starvation-inducible DNA-binding protein